MTGKALPLEDSDFSISGRQDESDHACVVPTTTPPLLALPALPVLPALPAPPPETGPKSDGRLLVLFGIVFVLVAAGAFAYYFLNQDEIDSQIIDSTEFSTPDERMAKHYGVGALDSDHTHAALAVFVNGDLLDFSHPQFQIQSKYIHLEGNNSYLVHKHAVGVPLDMLFASLGLRITPACIELEYKDVEAAGVNRYCADGGSSSMTFLINGEVLHDIRLYEIKHGDRILISFGDSKLVLEQFEYLERLYIHGVPETIPTLPGDYISV